MSKGKSNPAISKSKNRIVYEGETLKAGSPAGLLYAITSPKINDHSIVHEFLMSYPSFFDAPSLLKVIVTRYTKKSDSDVQVRVLNLLRTWVDFYWVDFEKAYSNDSFAKDFNQFLDKVGNSDNKAVAQRIKDTITKKAHSEKKKGLGQESEVRGRVKRQIPMTFWNSDPEEIAKQLCLIECEYWSHIEYYEFFGAHWSKEDQEDLCPNISRILEWGDHIKATLQSAFCLASQEERIIMLSSLLKIAKFLKSNSNFNSLLHVIEFFRSVDPLKSTFGGLQVTERKALQDFLVFGSKIKNYERVRVAFAQCARPSVPFLMAYLNELLVVEKQPNEILHEGKTLINFQKRHNITQIIKALLQHQTTFYDFPGKPAIRETIASAFTFSMTEIIRLLKFEENSIVTEQDPATENVEPVTTQDGMLIAGTLLHIVDQYTRPTNPKTNISAFLAAFRSFTSPHEWLELLIKRWDATLSFADESIAISTQLRIINILKCWLKNHISDFTCDSQLMDELEDFLNNNSINPQCKALLDLLKKRQTESTVTVQTKFEYTVVTQSEDEKAEIRSKREKGIVTFEATVLDFEHEDLAKHICLYLFDIFCKVQLHEFLENDFTTGKQLYQRVHVLEYWVERELSNAGAQVNTVFNYFIGILKHLEGLNNWLAVHTIVSGLTACMDKEQFRVLRKIPSSDKAITYLKNTQEQLRRHNFSSLYYKLKQSKLPGIPAIEVFLYIMKEESKQYGGDYVNSYPNNIPLINLQKRCFQGEILEEMARFQRTSYPFQPDNLILEYLGLLEKNFQETRKGLPIGIRQTESSEAEDDKEEIVSLDFESLLTKLIESEANNDQVFIFHFLSVYPLMGSFCDEKKLFSSLTNKFNTTDSEKIKEGVLSVLSIWIDEFQNDFFEKKDLHPQLQSFSEAAKSTSSRLYSKYPLWEKFSQTVTKDWNEDIHSKAPSSVIPDGVDTALEEIITLMDLDSTEVARQLTLLDEENYRNLKVVEFQDCAWNKPKKEETSPNIMKSIRWFNTVSTWIKYEILIEPNLKMRTRKLMKIIDIVQQLRVLNNFSGIFQIMSALKSSCIHRLKQTFANLSRSPEHDATLKKTEEYFSNQNNYRQLRQILNNLNSTALPYLGMYLTDLTFMQEGNDVITTVEGTPRCNIQKLKLIGKTYAEILKFQKKRYLLYPVKIIQEYIKRDRSVYDDMVLTEFSRYVEPKEGAPKPNIPPLLQQYLEKFPPPPEKDSRKELLYRKKTKTNKKQISSNSRTHLFDPDTFNSAKKLTPEKYQEHLIAFENQVFSRLDKQEKEIHAVFNHMIEQINELKQIKLKDLEQDREAFKREMEKLKESAPVASGSSTNHTSHHASHHTSEEERTDTPSKWIRDSRETKFIMTRSYSESVENMESKPFSLSIARSQRLAQKSEDTESSLASPKTDGRHNV